MRSPVLIVTALVCAVLGLAACGGGRVIAPSLTATARPAGFILWTDPAAGVELSVPSNWTITKEKSPLLAIFSSGSAVISLWRYPDPGHIALTSRAQLHGALDALETAIRGQEPGVEIQSSGLTHVGTAGAVIVDAIEKIAGHQRRVRSEHVYVDGAELVLEAYAPVSHFSSIDHAVFSPVRTSLTLLHGGQPAAGQVTTSTTPTPTPTTTP